MWRPAPGDLLAGKYRVERTIAEGGMGLVVEATHVGLGHPFAVKLLRMPDATGETAALFDEARILAQLPGDHIAHAIDVGHTDQGQPYFVMELLVGKDLEAELQARGRLPVTEAVEYVLQACEGIAEAHAIGLVHRDLKPANLFLTRRRDGSPLVKVLDFGISCCARAAGGDTASDEDGPICGTPAYMAPEQFLPSARPDARCDQYALAVVLYELLTGTPPFAANSVPALCRLVRTSEPTSVRELAPEVPVPLASAITRALAKDPDDRFPDLAQFARAVARYGGPRGVASAHNVGLVLGRTMKMRRMFVPPLLADRWVGRRTMRVTIAATVLLAVGLIGWRLDADSAIPSARIGVKLATAGTAQGFVFTDRPEPRTLPRTHASPEPARLPQQPTAASPPATSAPPPSAPATPPSANSGAAPHAPRIAAGIVRSFADTKSPTSSAPKPTPTPREVFGAKR